MIDLTSSLYLGLTHPSGALRPWRALTLGRPAALAADPLARRLESRLARLLATEAAALGRSTAHLSLDLSTLVEPRGTILLDAASYPSLRWGAERAAGAGHAVRTFRRGDLRALARGLAGRPRGGLILTDGVCCGCNTPAPLDEYLAIALRYGASLVIDDTQAVGILGARPDPARPWGCGGGGTAAWLGLTGSPSLIVMASLAKALGAPLAAIAGPAAAVKRWRRTSETRVHSSPPAAAELAAVERALAANGRYGDDLRARLLAHIRRFRAVVGRGGIWLDGGLFPIQSVAVDGTAVARELRRRLKRAGVLGVLQGAPGGGARVTFVLTAALALESVERAAALIADHASACHAGERAPAGECARCGSDRTLRRAA